ncbi:MAG: IS1595 family transposase [Dongiaceae bacterium]
MGRFPGRVAPMTAKKTKKINQMTIGQFEAMFPDDDACKKYLMAHRWPKGVHCPRCGNENVYELPSRPFHWQCHQCAENGYRFSVLVGTIFENTNYPLRDWFRVIHMMLTSKKGVSALQVHRTIGTGSYRTAWSMCHRIRAGLADVGFQKLMGIVEVDETFVGGKAHNKHKRRKGGDDGPSGRGGIGSGKTPVVGAVSRKGNVVARVIETVSAEHLTRFVHEAVSNRVSLLVTDEWTGYRHLKHSYPHRVIKHTKGDYVIGAVHTNTIEGFWSIFKRGVVGTYHKVSKKYLSLYVAEFQFRYNNRNNPDIFGEAIRGC